MVTEIHRYSGTWRLFEKEKKYQGELHINCDKRVIALDLVLPATEGNPIPRPPYKGKIPYICGTLFSGAKILLYDCSTGQEHSWVTSHTQQIIYANYAFWGLEVNSEKNIKFNKAIFDFGEIIDWSGLCHYKWEFADDGSSNLMWFHQEPIMFELNDNVEITFSPSQGRIGCDIYGQEVKANQHILVEFAYKNLTTWDSIMEDVLCMRYLIGLGVSQRVEINNAQYCHSAVFTEFSNESGTTERIHSPTDMIFGTGNVQPIQKTMPYYFLYTLENIRGSNAFIKWRENYSMLKPVLDLYFTAFTYSVGTPEMLFLNLVQALETYHSRFITNDAKEYSDRVIGLVDSICKGDRITEQWRNFLLDEGQKKNTKTIYLRSRLADLVYADGKLPFEPYGLRKDAYIKKIVDTRNYYTHYNPEKHEKAFTKAELLRVNAHLLVLLEYHLLVLMGFDIEEVRIKTVEKINRIDDACQIKEHTHDIER